jgi:CheY-like chemotaxis protein
VRIIVSDSGKGIEDEILPSIMEPFFTTKAAEHGTGLGLAVARAFVEECRGRLCVDTAVGRGTTFTLELPAAEVDTRLERPATDKVTTRTARSAVVLIAEDDPRIRETMAHELEKHGHSVLQANNGLEALEQAKRAPHVDLLCTDLSMPRLGGEKLLRLFGELHAGARVLVCSAYAHEPGLREFVQAGRYAVLPKPFSPAELARAVHDALGPQPA